MIKGRKKLNKTIGKVLKPFGIDRVKCAGDYSYVYTKNLVTFKLTEGTIEDELFKDFIRERFNYEVKYPFIISLLHECGHANYNDDVEGEVYDFCLSEKARIEKEMIDATTEEDIKRLEYQYFNLPDEIMATTWAIDYAKKHPKKIKKMWTKCEKALHTFYKVNKVREGD